jgi:hypothetical protein
MASDHSRSLAAKLALGDRTTQTKFNKSQLRNDENLTTASRRSIPWMERIGIHLDVSPPGWLNPVHSRRSARPNPVVSLMGTA